MAQYPIPQFIESEGKIISFLTFRQFFVLVGGGAIVAAAYYLIHNFFFFLVLAIPVGLVTAAIAFLKIDGVSIVSVVLDSMLFLTRSKDYVWKKKEYPYPFKIKSAKTAPVNTHSFSAIQNKANILNDTKKIIELRKK